MVDKIVVQNAKKNYYINENILTVILETEKTEKIRWKIKFNKVSSYRSNASNL